MGQRNNNKKKETMNEQVFVYVLPFNFAIIKCQGKLFS